MTCKRRQQCLEVLREFCRLRKTTLRTSKMKKRSVHLLAMKHSLKTQDDHQQLVTESVVTTQSDAASMEIIASSSPPFVELIQNEIIFFSLILYLSPVDVGLLAKTCQTLHQLFLGMVPSTNFCTLVNRWWFGHILLQLTSLKDIFYPEHVPWHSWPPQKSPQSDKVLWCDVYGRVYKMSCRKQKTFQRLAFEEPFRIGHEIWNPIADNVSFNLDMFRYKSWCSLHTQTTAAADDNTKPSSKKLTHMTLVHRRHVSDDDTIASSTSFKDLPSLIDHHFYPILQSFCAFTQTPCRRRQDALQRKRSPAIESGDDSIHFLRTKNPPVFSQLSRDPQVLQERYVPLNWDGEDCDASHYVKRDWTQSSTESKFLLFLIISLMLVNHQFIQFSIFSNPSLFSPIQFLDHLIHFCHMFHQETLLLSDNDEVPLLVSLHQFNEKLKRMIQQKSYPQNLRPRHKKLFRSIFLNLQLDKMITHYLMEAAVCFIGTTEYVDHLDFEVDDQMKSFYKALSQNESLLRHSNSSHERQVFSELSDKRQSFISIDEMLINPLNTNKYFDHRIKMTLRALMLQTHIALKTVCIYNLRRSLFPVNNFQTTTSSSPSTIISTQPKLNKKLSARRRGYASLKKLLRKKSFLQKKLNKERIVKKLLIPLIKLCQCHSTHAKKSLHSQTVVPKESEVSRPKSACKKKASKHLQESDSPSMHQTADHVIEFTDQIQSGWSQFEARMVVDGANVYLCEYLPPDVKDNDNEML